MENEMTQKPQLGNIVRDVTTGFTGTAFQYVELLTGSTQLAIQPLLKEGETHVLNAEGIPPAMNVDVDLLDYISDGIISRVKPAAPQDIRLGDEVEDNVTGLKGIVITRVTFINGCVYYHVQPRQNEKQKKDAEFSGPSFFPSVRLKTVSSGVAEQMAPVLTMPAEKRPGGPSTKATRA
jgi:hypothetical protein